jgi:hypothetical protein
LESTPTRGLDLGAGLQRPLAEHDARGAAVLDDDSIDGRVCQDRAPVLEEALRERVDLDFVAAHADAGGVVEGEGDAVGALAAGERRAVLPERHRRH